MNIETVMSEIATALATITGLRVYPWGPGNVEPPAAAVLLPERVLYNTTYARGYDMLENLQVVVAVGAATNRTAVPRIAAYAAGSGAQSVVAKIQGATYSQGVTCTLVDCTFPEITWGGKPLLAALFTVSVHGPGA